MRKTKNYLKKTPNGIEKAHPDFSEERKEERPGRHVGVFCQNLEIHDDFRTTGNASYNDLSQLINTLSNI